MPAKVVVFDTSVVIPLVLATSRSRRLFVRLLASGWQVAVSPQILDEVARSIRKPRVRDWLDLSDARIDQFVVDLAGACLVTLGRRRAHGVVAADPDDDKIIAAAMECNARYIVTEDRHLLTMKMWRGIRIVTRTEMMAELDHQRAA